ncbi:hypothetical protein [Leptospira sp. GIMC2001]|uniref:hypothetical protein n=1 Tax=Leptospira sp. GIMC2001 TaxID=1513297 RepID=UPI00234AFD72|nr:hypothetical protein [Leptospira sp. GIMC2001]WCL50474.1 hypothetical protein O4O04_06535 [Leptospira sp. GIMC2001]
MKIFQLFISHKMHFVSCLILLGLLPLVIILLTAQDIPFSDFAILEWQSYTFFSKDFSQGLYFSYSANDMDPEFRLFPLPDHFFHMVNNQPMSVFPPILPFLYSFLYGEYFNYFYKFLQLTLFIGSILLLQKMKPRIGITILTIFGSQISIYIFLLHETILVFFLQSAGLFLLYRNKYLTSGLISGLIVLFRPEAIFVGFLPLLFLKHTRSQKISKSSKLQFLLAFSIGLAIVGGTQWAIYNSIFGLRIEKNILFHFDLELQKSLLFLVFYKLPIFTLFLILSLASLIWIVFRNKAKHKSTNPLKAKPNQDAKFNEVELEYRNLQKHSWFISKFNFPFILLVFILLVFFLSPNHGGHNTPRYFFVFLPFLILICNHYLIYLKKSFRYLIMASILFIGSINLIFTYTELKQLSNLQNKIKSQIQSIDYDTIVFTNPDISFCFINLFKDRNNYFLLRDNKDMKILYNAATKKNWSKIAVVDMVYNQDPKDHFAKICDTEDCSFRFDKRISIDNSELPWVVYYIEK